ncbi:uncharacterized protein LOC124555767 [Schistocerca americana]|uniref:uncharacterized protein LOC124555767 n=1 Tax=Schistocerca americana TaxID=7009 RepID=UPI001F4FF5FA|nr:uncharacterized protein LOC124555767 [Schistocerca americana]
MRSCDCGGGLGLEVRVAGDAWRLEAAGAQFAMLSFSVEPHWCGALYSLCARHERALPLPHLADAFACSAAGPPVDVDWIAVAGTFGFEICSLSSTWALAFEAVKASGVILLLGVGSLVCYKLYNYYWPRSRSRLGSPDSSPSPQRRSKYCFAYSCAHGELIEDVEEEDDVDIQGCYFGPLDEKEKVEWSAHSSESEADTDPSKLCRCVRHCPVHHKAPCSSRHRHPRLRWRCPSHMTSAPQQKPTTWLLRKLSDMMNIASGHQVAVVGSHIPQDTPSSREIGKCQSMQVQLLKSKEEPMLISFSEDKDFYCQACHEMPLHTDRVCGETVTDTPHLIRDESYDSLGFSKGMPSEGSLDSVCSELSLDLSLPEISLGTSTMVRFEGIQQVINQIKSNCDNMSEDFETIKCNRNLPGMSSLMKGGATCDQDIKDALPEEEAENVKEQRARACFAGLYSLTVINNSTSSELSDACLNTDNKQGSFGSAESFEWDSPNHVISTEVCESPSNSKNICVNESEGLNSASDYIKTGVNIEEGSAKCNDADYLLYRQSIKVNENTGITTAASEDDLMAHLEWDDDLTEFTEENGNTKLDGDFMHTLETLEMDMEAELQMEEDFAKDDFLIDGADSAMTSFISTRSGTDTCSIEKYSGMESSGFGSLMLDSSTSVTSHMLPTDGSQNKEPHIFSNAEESAYIDWDMGPEQPIIQDQQEVYEKSVAYSSSCTSEISTPMTENSYSDVASPSGEHSKEPTTENIGSKVDLLQYALKEWKGSTKKAETILKGYAEIPSTLGVSHLRRIRGDNYCGVRAAVFQVLAQGLTVPSAYSTLQYLMSSEGHNLVQDWTFAGRLPYEGSNVLFGIESCLQSLDNMPRLLASHIADREDEVTHILNSDPTMDLHIMEAVKLHMLKNAIELYHNYTNGEDVPLFAMLMFSRDTSETPRELMRNHLLEVGNTAGLEQIEMFLLGFTLHVTLRVVRPSMYGTEEYICCYPENSNENWPQVLLIAEDDRHYNVLVE